MPNSPTPNNPRTQAQGRDPRQDPREGDVLSKKYEGRLFEVRTRNVRRVDQINEPEEAFLDPVIVSYFNEDRARTGECSLPTWRRWAKNAEVIHRAD